MPWLFAVVTALIALLVPTVGASPAAASPEWTWPIDPPPDVVRDFAPPARRWLPGHRGVDLAADAGTPVLAAGAGHVTYAGLLAGRGVVVVSHGDLRTTYEPVAPSVTVGQRVAAGEMIGALSLHGGHCLPTGCLHWGLRRGNVYLHPLALVGARPVRLLPLGDLALPTTIRDSPASATLPGPAGAQADQREAANAGTLRFASGAVAGPAGRHSGSVGSLASLDDVDNTHDEDTLRTVAAADGERRVGTLGLAVGLFATMTAMTRAAQNSRSRRSSA